MALPIYRCEGLSGGLMGTVERIGEKDARMVLPRGLGWIWFFVGCYGYVVGGKYGG